jgi:hypothetical protein
VVDTLPRLVMRDYDYRCLADIDDDVLLIEWDLAVDREGFERFIDLARSNPGDVLVAPYRLYKPTRTGAPELPQPIWCHRRYGPGETSTRFVTPDDETCHMFGLGLAYLPRAIVRAYLAAWPDLHFSDSSFSGWHYRHVRQETPIAWDVRPAHLHYAIDRM